MQLRLQTRQLPVEPQAHPQDRKLQVQLLRQALYQLHGTTQPHAHPHTAEEAHLPHMWESLPTGPVPPQPPESPRGRRHPLWLPHLWEELPGEVRSGQAPLRGQPGRHGSQEEGHCTHGRGRRVSVHVSSRQLFVILRS